MKASLRKLYLLILAIIILPSVIFVIYELGTLRQSEKIIEDIYYNQLDAILYSINQYSEDVVSSWANRINNEQSNNQDLQNTIERIHTEMPSVQSIYQFDDQGAQVTSSILSKDSSDFYHQVDVLLTSEQATIDQLMNYMQSGYRKIEAIDLKDGSQMIVFITNFQNRSLINILELDSEAFINTVLDPKIQEIAGERFFITAYLKDGDRNIYSSDKQHLPESVSHRKTFWVLDDYYLGIEMRDKTISELAWERSKKDLIIIGIVELVLLIGVWIIFRSVKNQMELAQLKSDFVSNVSHEIRTPLALISMYIESLERGMARTPEKVNEYYSIIMLETQRLTAIVNKILNFSQLESGKRKFTYHNTNLNEVINGVVASFRVNLETQEFEWEIDEPEEPIEIVADKEAITDATVNLIDNAIKYSGSRKKIDLKVGKEGNEAFIEITDHGIGISKTEQKYIFDKFYRVTDKNLAHKAKGSGVGLSIVRQIVEAHEGHITIKSKPGVGTSFRMYFPLIKTAIP